ncbi:MAG: M23 family metallopeptidase [Caldilineales bacterium]|nr:M23 family metallopeptidase [Caldilineales bacterium]
MTFVRILFKLIFCFGITFIATSGSFPVEAQTQSFLVVPYYGGHDVTSWFDHQYPNYGNNDRIEIYDGTIAYNWHGICGYFGNNAVAYYAQPNSQGDCIWYEGHPAIDFALSYEPVLAAADGVVVERRWWNFADRSDELGMFIKIEHSEGYETYYAHLSAAAVYIGQIVSAGQVIGTSGNTGNSSGPHLHFEVRHNGNRTDPFGGSGSSYLWREGRWQTGQWVGRSERTYLASHLIDDGDTAFVKGRTINGSYKTCPPQSCPYWYPVSGVGTNGDMLWTFTAKNSADYWARWQTVTAGLETREYDVQVYIPSSHTLTWKAEYCPFDSYTYRPTTQCMIVDQNGIGNRWIDLGTHWLGSVSAANHAGIWIDDETGEEYSEAGRNELGVDAIRFRVRNHPMYFPLQLR